MAPTQIPSTLQPYFEKGILAYTQGSYEYAVDLLTYVIKHAPDATEARRYLRLAIQKQYSQAPPSRLTQLVLLVVSLPIQFWTALAVARGQYQQAIALYERLLSFQPRSRSLLLGLASTLSLAGLDDAASATYEELLSVDPNHLVGLKRFARLAMRRSQEQQARQCLERILSLAPNDLEAQQNLRNLDALGTLKKGFST